MALPTKQHWIKFARWLLGLREPVTRTRVWSIYALQCRDGTYYIGITSKDPRTRYSEHAIGKGSNWTRLHPPIRMLWSRRMGYMREGLAVDVETNTTLYFISLYGVENVRGGRLVATDSITHRLQYEMLVRKMQLAA